MRSRPRRIVLLPTLLLLVGALVGAVGSSDAGGRGALAATPTHATFEFGALGALVGNAGDRADAITPTVLHFDGNPPEDACTGTGSSDVVAGCSILSEGTGTLSTGPAAHWDPPDAFDGTNGRNIYDPNWLWTLGQPTTIVGDMKIDWWASCGLPCPTVSSGEWIIRLFVDPVAGTLPAFEQTVIASPAVPGVPALLTTTVTVPLLTATESFLLHIDPVFLTMTSPHIYYDTTLPCPGVATGPCDSTVTMPVSGPTAARLLSFAARAERGSVVLRWRTGSEVGVVGFNVWRRSGSVERKTNRSLVTATGRAGGATYRLVDRTAKAGARYTYRLQAVHRNGSRSWYGAATVRAH